MRSGTRIAEATHAAEAAGHATGPTHAHSHPKPINRDGRRGRPGRTEAVRGFGQDKASPRSTTATTRSRRSSGISRAQRSHGLLAMTLGQYKAMATPPAVTSRAAASLHPRRRSAGQDEAHAAPPTQGGLGFVPVGDSCRARRAAAPIGVVPARVAFPRAAATAAAASGARRRQRQADGA